MRSTLIAPGKGAPAARSTKKADGRNTVGFLCATAGAGVRCRRESDTSLRQHGRLQWASRCRLRFREPQMPSNFALAIHRALKSALDN
jgi:hypothetical protein